MTGILGSANLLNGPSQAIYINGKDSATIATVNICNRNKSRSALVRIAVSTSESPADTDWIEYDVEIKPGGVLERNGVWVDSLQYIVVRSNIGNVSAVVWGATKGNTVVAPSLTPVSAGSITWSTSSLSLVAYRIFRTNLLATDSNNGTVFYNLTGGSLPSGLGLSSDGTLEGRIMVTGAYSFTITASNGVNSVSRTFSGTITSPASSALDLISFGLRTDGVYAINLPTVGLTNVYCLLDQKWDGGGWMMAMKASSNATTFNYASNLWTTDNTLNATTQLDQSNNDAKFEVMNKFAAKDIMARWPDILSNSGQIPNVGTWTWLQNNFFSGGSRTTLINFFNTSGQITLASGVTNAKNSGAWGGFFSSSPGAGFYGFNFTGNPSARVRWGFAWNNEADFASNDVSGGIGMDTNFLNLSAGDKINCCQDSTGINRPAPVEIYVR